MQDFPVDDLTNWFKENRREFPWRENPSPYAVWVSEVMLQQTQAATVVPYFLRFMARFPTIEALAKASIEEVMKEWEGLGYYSRARNLHEGAKAAAVNFKGLLPDTKEALSSLKGLGPYTIGAILSFAFKQKASAVDGNVTRVLTRFFAIDEDICKPSTLKKLQKLAFDLLPQKEPYIASEALIELGATICRKKPDCFKCPIQKNCLARRHGEMEKFPVKAKKNKIIKKVRQPLLIMEEDRLLIRQCPQGEVMAGLYEFPYLEEEACFDLMEKRIEERFSLKADYSLSLPREKHSFTTYLVTLFPHLFKVKKRLGDQPPGYFFASKQEITAYPFSSGHRKILNRFIF